jgi:hypothetical protein
MPAWISHDSASSGGTPGHFHLALASSEIVTPKPIASGAAQWPWAAEAELHARQAMKVKTSDNPIAGPK